MEALDFYNEIAVKLARSNSKIGSRRRKRPYNGLLSGFFSGAAMVLFKRPSEATPSAVVLLDALACEHLDVLYRFAVRLTGCPAAAEDLVQETFLVAQNKLDQLRDPSAAKAWLFTILRRLSRRDARPAVVVEHRAMDEIACSEDEPTLLDVIGSDKLQSILDQMPIEFREPILLFYFQEFRYREIAEILECPLGTVMSRIARGKEFMRRRLEWDVREVATAAPRG
ncbi:MAG: RNA polymerase sigma factor [Planctomycetia bacterium]